MSYLKVSDISKQYDQGSDALVNISLTLEKGEVVSLIGESGSGKSTLLKIIAGLEVQDRGEVYLGETRILNPSQKLVSGYDEIKLIHQGNHLYPNSTVGENISRPLLMYDKAYREERVKLILEMLNLTSFEDKYPRQLSGGQQQKVAIGRAMSIEPEVLLLDEPFSSLDTIQKRELIEELRAIFDQMQMTVLFVTHDLDDALMMSGNLVILQKGKIVQEGKAEDIFRNPTTYYTAKLFSHLNIISDKEGAFIRPMDILIKNKGRNPGKVSEKKFLIHFNQLTVIMPEGEIWKVEDKERTCEVGEDIYLDWDKNKEVCLSFVSSDDLPTS
ncbi:ABC transporter ATP-binding protein [Anditalea andensis]|uniref:Spermidine/putrescine ABC transporter ATP-binding protein n=1 Tax=Anditalea andensis TaxID=1048983 RepID=A0A074L4V4_9BACT|nr:ABC transporter ATP-binding protein [Anditalea andensis]KEO74883.1 spermidine/putrescine ABC transporter ATP-binding protein [Anditalea andensis]